MAIPMKEGDEEVSATESLYEDCFWRRRLDEIALDVIFYNKKCFPIEFQRTQDYRHTYEERARNRASEQYKNLLGKA